MRKKASDPSDPSKLPERIDQAVFSRWFGAGSLPKIFVDSDPLPLTPDQRDSLAKAGLFSDQPAAPEPEPERDSHVIDLSKVDWAKLRRRRRRH